MERIGKLPGAGRRDPLLARPLLDVTREETEAYCREHSLQPRTDSTNYLPKYTRNYLRLEVLPALRHVNPRIREALLRLAENAASDLDWLRRETDKAWRVAGCPVPGGVELDRATVRAMHPAIQRHLLRKAVEAAAGSAQGLEAVHIEEMTGLLSGPTGRSLRLPGGLQFLAEYDRCLLLEAHQDSCPLPPLEDEHPLTVPGVTTIAGWRISALIGREPRKTHEPSAYRALLDPALTGQPFTVRSRRPGDRFQPLGMEQIKRLQDFMVDAHVPRSWRDRVPLVCVGGRIAWVVGWRIAHWPRAPEAGDALILEFKQQGGN